MENAKDMALALNPNLSMSTVYILEPVGKKGHCKLVGRAVINDENGNRISSGKTELIAWKMAFSNLRRNFKK